MAVIADMAAAQPDAGRGAGPGDPHADPVSAIGGRFANDCERVDLTSWSHPTRLVLGRTDGIDLRWLLLCRDRTLPVFGVVARFDMRGSTESFYHPLLDGLLAANGDWELVLVEVRDRSFAAASRSGAAGMTIDYGVIGGP